MSELPPAAILRGADHFASASGTFFRSIAAADRDLVLSGSIRPGRYSAANQPTLYLSASVPGVDAAMRSHFAPGHARVVVPLHVEAGRLLDLRDEEACRWAGVAAADALAPWKETVAAGHRPLSWDVRDRIEAAGAFGLVDPSRTAPGLWHLVLFAWNVAGAPAVLALP